MALSNRAPLARNPMRLADDIAASVLERPSTSSELLMTSVPPQEGLVVHHIQGIFAGRTPLRTSMVEHWPASCAHLQCMHCGGQCDAGPPVPVARQYEANQYWVYGPFCRPCCAFGYICETDATSKQLAATAEMLRRFFGLKSIVIAPPRAAHVRFGGPLGDQEFYGQNPYTCITTLQPPFVTFAHYVVGVNGSSATEVLLPQSAGRLVDLVRPAVRLEPLAQKKPTGQAPLILEFLATLTSAKDVKDVKEDIEIKSKKRKADDPVEKTNFLKKYVTKAS